LDTQIDKSWGIAIVYYYLYYRLYRVARKVGVVDATWSAMVQLSLLLFVNLGTVFVWLFGFGHPLPPSPRFWSLVVGCTILFMNYLIFIRKDRCYAIIAEFEKESRKQRIVGAVLLFLCVLATFGLIYFTPR
jgi:hypothetical protein